MNNCAGPRSRRKWRLPVRARPSLSNWKAHFRVFDRARAGPSAGGGTWSCVPPCSSKVTKSSVFRALDPSVVSALADRGIDLMQQHLTGTHVGIIANGQPLCGRLPGKREGSDGRVHVVVVENQPRLNEGVRRAACRWRRPHGSAPWCGNGSSKTVEERWPVDQTCQRDHLAFVEIDGPGYALLVQPVENRRSGIDPGIHPFCIATRVAAVGNEARRGGGR